MKATLKLVGVDLPRAKIKREPYVTSVAVSQQATGSRVPIQIHPRTPAEADADPATSGAFVVSTEPGAGLDRRYPLNLDVVLYDGDPGDWLVVAGAIMDSGGGHVRAGARIDAARHVVDGTSLGAAIAGGLVYRVGPTAGLVLDARNQVSQLLATNGDDVLCEFEVRIEGAAGFRDHAREFTVESKACIVRLRLEVEGLAASTDASPEIQALEEARATLDRAVEQAGAPALSPASPSTTEAPSKTEGGTAQPAVQVVPIRPGEEGLVGTLIRPRAAKEGHLTPPKE